MLRQFICRGQDTSKENQMTEHEGQQSESVYQDEYREANPTFGDELDIEPKTAHISKG